MSEWTVWMIWLAGSSRLALYIFVHHRTVELAHAQSKDVLPELVAHLQAQLLAALAAKDGAAGHGCVMY